MGSSSSVFSIISSPVNRVEGEEDITMREILFSFARLMMFSVPWKLTFMYMLRSWKGPTSAAMW